MTISVLIADDDELVRTGLRVIVDSEPGMTVAGEAATGAETIGKARSLRPDLVLMDVQMPGLDGIATTARPTETIPGPPKTLIITTFGNDGHVYDAPRAGRTASCSSGPAPPRCCRPSASSRPVTRCCSRPPSVPSPPGTPGRPTANRYARC
jgi:DNA-binding NarL/FixJ family response regulator